MRVTAILRFGLLSCFVCSSLGAASVWKVTGANGAILFLGGSVHALRPTDYPLPSAYNRAFDASSRLAFEEDPKAGSRAMKDLLKAGEYPRGDSLKNHVDPRTYAYLRRFFALRNVSEEEFARLRPWLIALLLESPPAEYFRYGVESFLLDRARANSKPIDGLETSKEHNDVFVGLSDRESEALLLILFIAAGRGESGGPDLVAAWRSGEVDLLARTFRAGYRDFPSLAERLLDVRNRKWMPKIESYLGSGRTYFVVAGAAHMGGPGGLVALLRARGYRVEQL